MMTWSWKASVHLLSSCPRMTIQYLKLKKRSIGDLTLLQSSKICNTLSQYLVEYVLNSISVPARTGDYLKLKQLNAFMENLKASVNIIESKWHPTCPMRIGVHGASLLVSARDSTRMRSVEFQTSPTVLVKFQKEMIISFALKFVIKGIDFLRQYMVANYGIIASEDVERLNNMIKYIEITIDKQDGMMLPFLLYMDTVMVKANIEMIGGDTNRTMLVKAFNCQPQTVTSSQNTPQ